MSDRTFSRLRGALVCGALLGCGASIDSASRPIAAEPRPAPRPLGPDSAAHPAHARGQRTVAPVAPGWLGVALAAREPHQPGVVISSILRGSPAAVQGLQVGDVVIGINDGRVGEPAQMARQIAAL